jgi:hypothetical protein
MEYTSNHERGKKTKRSQHVTGWTWKHKGLGQLCPKMFSDSTSKNPKIRATSHKNTESPQPIHFKHSHWWKRRSRSKFASHYAGGTN